MTTAELGRYQAVLKAKYADLALILRNRQTIAIEKASDALDEVQLAAERELAIETLDRESRVLRQVRAALARHGEGTYGICLHCEVPINPKRLDAVPWAAHCIRCQEALDQQAKFGQEEEQPFESVL